MRSASETNVTDSEHSGHRRHEAVAGDYEPFGVELDAHLVQPGRAWVRANHQEETGCVEPDVPLERTWSRQFSALSRLVP